MSVNGKSLVGLTHQEAVGLLKSTGDSLTLEATRRVSSKATSRQTSKQVSQTGSGDSTPKHSSGSPSPLPIRAPISKRRKQSITVKMGVSAQGVKVVELHKGPTGLGIHLKGSLAKETAVPITIKEILPGGVAYKSEKIAIGDVIMEANGIPFKGLTQYEAMKAVKGLPQGPVRLVLLDKRFASDL